MPASTTIQQLRRCLDAITFPANKDDLLAAADYTDCDADTIAALQTLQPQTYTTTRQVLAAVTVRNDDIAPGTGVQSLDP